MAQLMNSFFAFLVMIYQNQQAADEKKKRHDEKAKKALMAREAAEQEKAEKLRKIFLVSPNSNSFICRPRKNQSLIRVLHFVPNSGKGAEDQGESAKETNG